MTSTFYEVDYFQLNASLDTKGDCAIALLVLKDSKAKTPKPIGTIKSAVLIDSGQGQHTANLLVTICDKIKADYGLTGPLQFDAISLSHWDADHVYGFFHWLSKVPLWNGDQFIHFKYQNTGEPLTRLYSPKWKAAKKVLSSYAEIVKPSGADISTAHNINVNVNKAGRKLNVMVAYATPDLLLGRNLFTGHKITVSSDKISSPLELIEKNDPWTLTKTNDWKGAPGLYIVGVEQVLLGSSNVSSAPALRPGEVRVINNNPLRPGDANGGSIVALLIWPAASDDGSLRISLYTAGDAEYQVEEALSDWLDATVIKVIKAGHHGSAAGTSTKFVDVTDPDHYLVSAGTEHGHPGTWALTNPGKKLYLSLSKMTVPEVLLYMDAWFSRYKSPEKRIHAVCYPYYLGFVEEDGPPKKVRFFNNRLTDPDSLTISPKKPDKFYVEFVRLLQSLWVPSVYATGTDPVSKFTTLMGAVDTTALQAAQTAYDNAKGSAKKTAKGKLREENKKVEMAKAQKIAPALTEIWLKWSDIQYQQYPSRAFDDDDQLPTNLRIIDYVGVSFAYDEDKDARFSYVEGGVDYKTAFTTQAAKKAKAASTASSMIVKSAMVGARKRTREEDRLPVNEDFLFSMTTAQEAAIQRRELDGDIDYTTPPDYMIPSDSASDSLVSMLFEESASAPSKFIMISASDGLTGADVLQLDPASNVDYFVAALKDGHLLLASEQTSANLAWESTLSTEDGLLLWFSSFISSPASNLTLHLKGQMSAPYILVVQLQLNFPSQAGTSQVIYSSTAFNVMRAFNIRDAYVEAVHSIVDPSGFLQSSTGMVLGLVNDASSSTVIMKLSDMFALLEMDIPLFLDSNAKVQFYEGDDTASGIWICPSANDTTTWRMNFSGDTTTAWFAFPLPGLTFSDCKLLATKQAYRQTTASKDTARPGPEDHMVSTGSICIHANTQLKNTSLVFETYILFGVDLARIKLRWNYLKSNPLTQLFDWMQKELGIDAATDYSNFDSIISAIGSSLSLRDISITAIHHENSWHFSSLDIVFEMDLKWGVKDPSANPDTRVPLQIAFSYIQNGNSPSIKFSGGLWPTISATALALTRLNPDAPMIPLLTPIVSNPQFYISLFSLDGLDENQKYSLPAMLPTNITALNLSLGYASSTKTSTVAFTGQMVEDKASTLTSATKHWLVLDKVFLRASYTTNLGALSFDFSAEILLNPRQDFDLTYVAILDMLVSYDSTNKAWTIGGSVTNINVACLYSLFPESDNDAVMNLMQEIVLSELDVQFSHDSSSMSFSAGGTILLGEVQLELTFNCGSASSSDSGWEFSAKLSEDFSIHTTDLGAFLGSISSDIAAALPDFISAISLAILGDASIRLDCFKVKTDTDSLMILSVVVKVTDFEFSFVQVTKAVKADSSTTTKRLFKITMDTIPGIKQVPLLDTLSQPFDQLDFLWTSEDFTREEVETLNVHVYHDRKDQLVFKDPALTTSDTSLVDSVNPKNSKVILAGCHFVVIAEENNQPTSILDYNFSAEPTSQQTYRPLYMGEDTTTSIVPQDRLWSTRPLTAFTSVDTETPYTKNYGSAIGIWSKTFGPLTISAIGLKFISGSLTITLDATIKLGPIEGTVKGFAIQLPLKELKHIDLDNVKLSFEGIGLEMNKPPIVLAGMLLKVPNGFAGGVTIEVEPYTFMAGGYYGEVTKPSDKDKFKTIFVFAELDGPIAELEFASLSGLTGGVGYNSLVTLPTIDNVTTFPFLAAGLPDADPLSVLSNFINAKSPWFTPADGPAWVAGGLTVTAFQILIMKAVVVVDLTEDVIFGVYADCIADVPAAGVPDEELFARVDLGLLAIVDPNKGIFYCEGQLTPKSFILDRNCHLRGGFALCYWFEGSGHDGDWVFTVGGYHSAYIPPTWYPTPPRLSISWKYDSAISILGEAYFAITPKVAMGGGKLNISYQSGHLSAYFDAYADFLINYRPFFFVAEAGINIAIKYTRQIFWMTKSWDIHFGASIAFHGPPLSGVAHIDWCIVSFDVHFGSPPPPPLPLKWEQFCSLLRQDKQGEVLPDDQVTGQHMHCITFTSGVIADSKNQLANVKSNALETTLVNSATFSCRFATLFPIANYIIPYGDPTTLTYKGPTTFMKPMQILEFSAPVMSKLILQVTQQNSSGENVSSPNAKFKIQPLLKQMPSAIWDPYNIFNDPSTGLPAPSLLSTTNSTKEQMMGIDLVAPEPTVSPDSIQFSIALGSEYPVDVHPVLPGPESLPPIFSLPDTSAFEKTSKLWAPFIPAAPTSSAPTNNLPSPQVILRPMIAPSIARHDLVASWMDLQGIGRESSKGERLLNLEDKSGDSQHWVAEMMSKPEAPLPRMSLGAMAEI